jgi:hypothetical protein
MSMTMRWINVRQNHQFVFDDSKTQDSEIPDSCNNEYKKTCTKIKKR